jgi:cellulose synthase/poly-beta-1,6-N-acetylglucosamine synthase-like glycosyltransferase
MLHAAVASIGVVLILVTLPGTIELALLTLAGLLPARKPQTMDSEIQVPVRRMAALIPAHNEEANIADTVRSLAECLIPEDLSEFAIVVVADNCSDATAEVARKAGADVLERHDERRGKGYALQYAFDHLTGEGFDAVLVIDADTKVESNLLAEMISLLKQGADGVQARYGVLNPETSIRTRLMSTALMAFNVLRPRARQRLGLSAGILGNGFTLSAATLKAVPYDAHSIVEDLEYGLRIVRASRRIAFADATAVRGLMPGGKQGAGTQRARWEGGRFHMMARYLPRITQDVLRGETSLIEPMLDLMLLPLAFHVTLLLLTLATPFAPARIYALGALALVAFHVCAGIIVGGGGWCDLAALTAAPLYAIWKLQMLPRILRAAAPDVPWQRTER